jgi:branched-chain amino acid transport system substrate-binding protein
MNARNIFSLTVFALATLGAATSAVAQDETVVKIGHIAPLTGAAAHVGKDLENGARLAIDEINQAGLVINGQKVKLELDSQDDASDPRIGTEAAQRLIDDKVVAVVGHLNSGVNIPASKLYNDAGITNITPAASNPLLTLQGFKTEFRLVATDADQGPALAKFAATGLHLKTVAVVDDATAYGQGLTREFEKSAKSQGFAVTSHEVTNDKAVDFRGILTKIKADRPDLIMFGGMDATGGPLAKQAKQLAISSKLVMGDGACTANLGSLAGPAAGNIYCSEGGVALSEMPRGRAFQAEYEKRFNVPIQSYAPYSYDAVYVVVDAMKRAQSIDPAKILAAMPSTNYAGVTGQIRFKPNGDLLNTSVSIYQYKDGQKTFMQALKD